MYRGLDIDEIIVVKSLIEILILHGLSVASAFGNITFGYAP